MDPRGRYWCDGFSRTAPLTRLYWLLVRSTADVTPAAVQYPQLSFSVAPSAKSSNDAVRLAVTALDAIPPLDLHV